MFPNYKGRYQLENDFDLRRFLQHDSAEAFGDLNLRLSTKENNEAWMLDFRTSVKGLRPVISEALEYDNARSLFYNRETEDEIMANV